MKRRIISVVLALCLSISFQSVASAEQEVPSLRAEAAMQLERAAVPQGEGSLTQGETFPAPEEGSLTQGETFPAPEEGSSPQAETFPAPEESSLTQEENSTALKKATLSQETAPLQQEASTEESLSVQAADTNSGIPTPTQVYEAMIALKDQEAYKEGTTWTDYIPYSGTGYSWKGGLIDGVHISAVGCVAFAFILSDTAFDSLPNRMYAAGGFTYEDIKAGDILRVNNDTHTVIVLEANEAGVVVAEGNYNGTVHWGRAISREEVMSSTSHYITRYPEGYVPPDDPTASEIIGSGPLDTGLSWSLTKAGTLTISGSGAMPDFGGITDQPWSPYSSQIRTVVIGEGVTSIGSCAFWKCGVLNVSIPASVTTIGNYAFRESSIISVEIPSGVKTIGSDAFHGCANLSSVAFSEGLEAIGERAFQSCAGLTSINLPATIGEVGAGAFWQCSELQTAAFAPGSGQVKLGDNLFTQCYRLMGVTLPQSIDRIGEGMFQNCLMLPGVEIPQGAESIGGSAFASSGVSVVLIPDSVTSIGTAAFASCPLKDIYFTGTEAQWNSVSKLGDTAAAVAKAAIHYEYSPEPTATPSPTAEPQPSATPGPTTEPQPTTSPGPTEAPEPSSSPSPTAAPEPSFSPSPTAAPEPSSSPSPTAAPTQAPDTMIPSIEGGSGREGWEAIKNETADASEGKQIKVNMNGASVVPGDVVDSVKGKDVTIAFDMGNGILWLVNGKNVTADHANDVDLSVEAGTSAIPKEIVERVAGNCPATQLSLAYSGDFGYSAVLVVNMDSAHTGAYANLFYYNESTDGLEFVTASQIKEDGTAELTFTHASDYVIVVNSNVMGGGSEGTSSENNGESPSAGGNSPQETESRSPKTGEDGVVIAASGTDALQHDGNGLHFMWLLLAGAVGLAAAGGIICLIRKKAKK